MLEWLHGLSIPVEEGAERGRQTYVVAWGVLDINGPLKSLKSSYALRLANRRRRTCGVVENCKIEVATG